MDHFIEINELVKSIEESGYIDCSEHIGYVDDNEFASILFYLKNIQSIINDIRNTEMPLTEKEKNKFEKLEQKYLESEVN